MKIAIIVLIAASVAMAAPVDEAASTKAKRGLSLGLGYHAPLLTHTYAAPTVYHAAPLYHAPVYHAPIITHHAPIITSHSLYSSYHLPAYSTLHHYK